MSDTPNNLPELIGNLVRAAMAESRNRRTPTQNYQVQQDLANATNAAVDALERATVDFAVGEWTRKVSP